MHFVPHNVSLEEIGSPHFSLLADMLWTLMLFMRKASIFNHLCFWNLNFVSNKMATCQKTWQMNSKDDYVAHSELTIIKSNSYHGFF
jgi:hypothetical protein